MHEHIICDSAGADNIDNINYNLEDIVEIMVPNLRKLKEVGCNTLVDATPPGEGRAVKI